MADLGVFVGNDHRDAQKFEEWLGADLDFISGHTGGSTWSDVKGSLGWIDYQFDQVDTPVHWSIPMLVDGGSLQKGANGAYNGNYRDLAKQLVDASGDQESILVRTGQEFNGGWFKWAAKGQESEYIQTYQNLVDSFESVSDKFVFEWTVNAGDMGMDPATAYPGDEYVDVIGMDFYYNTTWYPEDASEAWDFMVNREYGLQWLEDFADDHDKPTAYSEWGVDSNARSYIESAAEWFDTHDVLYQSYWNSNADFPGKLSSGQYAQSGAAYVDAFAKTAGDTKPAPAPDTTPDATSDATAPAASGAWQTWMGGTSGNDNQVGDGGRNKIDGGGGSDTMIGKGGDDIYTVDRPTDTVIEQAGQGIDTIDSYAKSYTLPNHVEHMNLVASYSQTAIGNGLDNRISGGAGNDTIEGRGGDDWLTGKGGQDTFRFTPGDGHDAITDFSTGDGSSDRLDLSAFDLDGFSEVKALMSNSTDGVILDLPGTGDVMLFDVSVANLGNEDFLL